MLSCHQPGDGLVALACIGGQQDLCSLAPAHRMPAVAEHNLELGALGLAQLDPVAYVHPRLPPRRGPDECTVRRMPSAGASFTERQGQYLAFIHAYTRVHGRPPAEADMQRYFRVSPPSVHQMVLTLERAGLIQRKPGLARSIEVLVEPEHLPVLRSRQPVKSSVQGN